MNKGTKITIWTLSVLSLAGIGYFIWSKIKMSRLNNQITDVSTIESEIDNLDISDIDIPADVSTEPELPMPNSDFSTDDTTGVDGIDYDSINLIVYTKSGARLRSEPSTSSTIIATYQLGEVFFVLGTSNEADGLWYNVDDGVGVSGWFRNDVVTTD
jgi:uncharacterized protein YgiM (DUF1202 family)